MLLKLPANSIESLNDEEYLHVRCAVLRFFEWNGVSDPADLADEVFYRLLNSSNPGIKNWHAFAHGIAQHVLMEHRRAREREKALRVVAIASPSPSVIDDELPRNLEACLQCLRRAERSLILAFYGYEEGSKAADRAALARSRHLSENALHIRVCRIRKKLVACLEAKRARTKA